MAYDLGTARGTIELEYEGRDAVQQANRDMDKVEKKSKDTDGALRKLGEGFKTLGGAVASLGKLGGMASTFAAAAVSAADLGIQIAGIIPQLASLSSLSAILPGLISAIGISVGVLKASMAGMGDTVKAAFDTENPEKFNEALKKLAPNAQEFAKALKENAPALREIQQGIQDAFFSTNLQQFIPQLVSALRSMRPELNGLATDFSNFAREFLRVGLEADSIEFLNNVLLTTRDNVQKLEAVIEPLLSGLRDVGFVGMTLMDQLGDAVLDLGVRFGDWLTQIANDGRLEGWIETAIATLNTLGDLLGNIGSILASVFQAAGAASGGLLQTLERITGEFAAFLNSAEGMAAMESLFTGIGAAASAVAPVITTLVGALAGALGPALQRLATNVGPVLLDVVNRLAPAFAPLANAIVDLLSAVAPLAPPLAQLVAMLAQLASGIVGSLVGHMGPLVDLLGDTFLSVLEELAPVINEALVQTLPLAAEAGQQLLEAFAPLAPIFVEFGRVLAQALLDNLPEIMSIMEQLVPITGQFATILAGELGDALLRLIPMIPGLVSAFVQLLAIFWQIQMFIVKLELAFLKFTSSFEGIPEKIGAFISSAGSFIKTGFDNAVNWVQGAIDSIVGFLSALPGRAGSALSALPGQVWNLIKNTMNQAGFLIGAGIGIAINLIREMPPKAAAALAALPGVIARIVSNAWNNARTQFTNGVNNARNIAAQLPSRIRSALSSLGSLLMSIARTGWNNLRTQFTNGVNNARNIASQLPGRLRGALGNIGGALVSAGHDAVMGLVRGIRGAIGAAVNAAVDVGRSVINGIKSTLKIGSPSKVMIEVGMDTVDGFAIGVLRAIKDARLAMKAVTDTVLQPSLRLGVFDPVNRRTIMPVQTRVPETYQQRQGTQGASHTYVIRIGDKTVATMVFDALTGAPTEVKKVNDEGSRASAWAGSGRTANA